MGSPARPEQCGAVTFIQRFGSALNLNVHFHTLALDGVYTYTLGHGGAPRFLPLPPPGVDEVARVLAGTARRIQRLVEARAEDDPEALARDEPLVALLAAASLRTRIATGAHRGEPWRRLGDRVEPRESESPEADPEASARVPHLGGMSLHADVAVLARDRRRLERLCRYVARPPLASERLEERSDGTLALRLKSRWRDGTTHILMERSELIERLVPLIPPPRAHQVRYHGILAPGASQRDRVVPDAAGKDSTESAVGWLGRCAPPPTAIEPGAATKAADLSKGSSGCSARFENLRDAGEPGHPKEEPFPHPDPHDRARRMRWAALLQRVFEVAGQLCWPSARESKIHRDALRCPRCGSTLRLIAAIEDPMVARRILECLELPARAPPLAPAAADAPDLEPGLDRDDGLFDQSPAHDEPDFLISGS